MPSLNRVILIGRLTRDPEMRYTSSGLAVTGFSIAVDRNRKSADGQQKQTDFFRCSAWRQLAEIVNEYARKGMLVAIDGSIRINEYQAQDGTTKQSVDVDVDNFQMLERAGEAGVGGGESSYHPDDEDRAPRAPQRAAAPARGSRDDDEDRPARPARAAAPASRGEARGDERPAPRRAPAKPAAEPMYPEDDFDDSDPFADE